MKFIDYNAQHEELWRKVRAAEERFQGKPRPPKGGYEKLSEWGSLPEQRALDAHSKPMQRVYWVSERAAIRIAPQGSDRVPYCADAMVQTTHNGETWMNTNPNPHNLSPAEHRAIGDVIEVVERWVAGEIDDLPPAGVWSEVKP
jgi:hypothetical protein